ncbi:MAG: hypothetical protein GEU71_15980 [Actinobacteria bacterium]|jgi:hypothetical protein|nr:hypothetical protein [Actinomycetota bacterium]
MTARRQIEAQVRARHVGRRRPRDGSRTISATTRRLADDRVLRAWLIAWLGGSVLGIVNGTARELLYKDRVGELGAHYISTASLMMLLILYMWLLEQKWPIPNLRSALRIGGIWFVLTIMFEFGFGHYVDGKTWAELGENYNLAGGHVWVVVPGLMTIGPAAVRQLARRSD